MSARAVLVAVLVVALGGCVAPAWGERDYELKAAATAEAAASTVDLARLAVEAEDRLTGPYLKTLLTRVVDDLGTVNDQFGAVQPPSGEADRLRTEVTDLTSEAEVKAQDLLIQVKRDGIGDPASAGRELGEIAERLRRVEETYQ
ncbi:hypothetical protein GCM10009677_04190 [Sphaerisporangium rubeum]|uniref:Uncharacterized protein n=1 Tax=Sphaerisporangium rubeum TaxID=321317 RepID=A0A7X0IA80_9ACTN|nr:hypothetical protein [Sphaerisporangium rubeum]MBB6470739.1 hypothetical protein [Sphaerisporangium rubeum]